MIYLQFNKCVVCVGKAISMRAQMMTVGETLCIDNGRPMVFTVNVPSLLPVPFIIDMIIRLV